VKYILLLCLMLTACGEDFESSTDKEARQQEKISKQAINSVGMPAITNFQEKRMMKMILELRDTAISTKTYIVDLNGHLHKLCDSIGYGLPYATQFTNPMMEARQAYALPQADPNGLYSPASADGTWVQCLDPASRRVKVVYIEPHVIVSPFDLGGVQ
jgi:hypothetical protein